MKLGDPPHDKFSYKKLLGVDYGRKTLGFASCDSLHIAVQPRGSVGRFPQDQLKRTLAALHQEHTFGAVVIGIPLLGDGTLDNFANECREFGIWLGKFLSLPVVYVSERNTTEVAKERFSEIGKRGFKARKDEIAACIILQDYIDS